MNAGWDMAARLMLCGLLLWRFASVLLRAAGLLCVWGGLIKIATGAGTLAAAVAVLLGVFAWLGGQRLKTYTRRSCRPLLAARSAARRRGRAARRDDR